MWDTAQFSPDKVEWPEDGSQPFYLSTGDNTGFGQHADYVSFIPFLFLALRILHCAFVLSGLLIS